MNFSTVAASIEKRVSVNGRRTEAVNPIDRLSLGMQSLRYRLLGGPRPSVVSGPVGTPLPDGDVMLGDLRAHTVPAPPADSDLTMDRPVRDRDVPLVMVHGMGQKADTTWFNFKNFFCANPHNVYGGTYQSANPQQFANRLAQHPEARIFAIDLSDNIATPQEVSGELTDLIGLVRQGTHCPQVDVLTHSMGALVAREHLRAGDGVRKLVMLAPPNHGSGDADAAVRLHQFRLYSHYPSQSMKVLRALRTQRNRFGWVHNKYLEGRDQSWKQSDWHKVTSYVITGAGVPTPAGVMTLSSGDGMVIPESAWLEHSEFYIAQPHGLVAGAPNFRDFEEMRYNHLNIISDPSIMHLVDDILAK